MQPTTALAVPLAPAVAAPPFTNLQMELLRVYSMNLPDEDLLAIRRLIARYLLEKARHRVNTISKERGYTQETLQQWLAEAS